MDERILYISKIVFIGLVILVASVLYIPIILKVRREHLYNRNVSDVIKEALDTLKPDSIYGTEEKAEAFITLILNSYVLVHTMINTGNKYDDKIQTSHFKENLIPDIAEKLNSLEDKDGQCTI